MIVGTGTRELFHPREHLLYQTDPLGSAKQAERSGHPQTNRGGRTPTAPLVDANVREASLIGKLDDRGLARVEEMLRERYDGCRESVDGHPRRYDDRMASTCSSLDLVCDLAGRYKPDGQFPDDLEHANFSEND